jgi:hypothetical protein
MRSVKSQAPDRCPTKTPGIIVILAKRVPPIHAEDPLL